MNINDTKTTIKYLSDLECFDLSGYNLDSICSYTTTGYYLQGYNVVYDTCYRALMLGIK